MTDETTKILFVCTGNICRSPMAEYLTKAHASRLGLDVAVLSAGLTQEGTPASDHAISVLAARGIDMSPHRSRLLSAELVGSADVVIGMTGRHVREAAVLDMEAVPRIYTLRELVRRAGLHPPRGSDEAIADYLARLHAARPLAQLGSGGPAEDVDDPYGRRKGIYKKTATELEELVGAMVAVLFPWAMSATA